MNYEDLSETAKRRVNDYDYQQKYFTHNKMVNPDEPAKTVLAHENVQYMLLVSGDNAKANGAMVQDLFRPGWTVTTRERFFITNKIKFRRLSVLELSRMMGFPDGYEFQGSKTAQVRQIGNAVCPPVAKALAEALK